MYLSAGYGPGIYATIDVVGYGRDWQFLGEDCTHRDFNLSRHVPDVVSQQRTDQYDPMVPWGGGQPGHQGAGSEVMGGDNVPNVKHEDNVGEDNTPEETEQEPVEITPMLPAEGEATEMVGVEKGG